MSPIAAWVIVLGIAKIPTHTSDVAIDWRSVIFMSWLNAGTITIPPPTPSNPERAPAPMPIDTKPILSALVLPISSVGRGTMGAFSCARPTA